MQRHVRQSIEAEERRQREQDTADIVDAAAKAVGLRPEYDEPPTEFRARVPAIVRGMAPYNVTAARFADLIKD